MEGKVEGIRSDARNNIAGIKSKYVNARLVKSHLNIKFVYNICLQTRISFAKNQTL